jgi:hypothetical protein
MGEPLRIRFSEIQTFLKCRKKHHYQWVQELELRKQDHRLLLGTWGHEVLKIILKGGSEEEARTSLNKEVQKYVKKQTYDDIDYNEMSTTAFHTGKNAAKAFLEKYTPVSVEDTLEYQLNDNVVLTGTPDVVALEKDSNMLWLFDHKFRNTFRPPASEIFNLQMIFYAKLLSLVKNMCVVGSKQFQIRPFLPKSPSINRDGTVSRKPITTDWDTYKAAVLSVGGNPADYADMELKLAGIKLFDLDSCTAYRPEEMIDSVWENEILPAVDLITKTKPETSLRCFDFGTCNYCEMQAICQAELYDEDTSIMLNSLYKKKGETSQLIIIEEDE